MQTETKYDGDGKPFEVPVEYPRYGKGLFHKIRKKATNITPKKKKRK